MQQGNALEKKSIFSLWYPLALSRIALNVDAVIITAFLARVADPTLTLAAFIGVVHPTMFFIESPVWMFLAASTSLSSSHRRLLSLRRFSWVLSALLTGLVLLMLATPLYDWFIRGILGADERLAQVSRAGFCAALPWIMLTSDRRVLQGVLIRFGYSGYVALGTLCRIIGLVAALIAGVMLMPFSGVFVGSAAMTISLLVELMYIIFMYRKLNLLAPGAVDESEKDLSWSYISSFYLPLACTSLLRIAQNPVGVFGLLRMPFPISSAAAAGAVRSLGHSVGSAGRAYGEVVIALYEDPEKRPRLWRFCLALALSIAGFLAVLILTPLGDWVFSSLLGLPSELLNISLFGLILFLPVAGLEAVHCYYEGYLIAQGKTRYVSESFVAALLTFSACVAVGIWLFSIRGAYVVLSAYSLGVVVQTLWLRFRARCHPTETP